MPLGQVPDDVPSEAISFAQQSFVDAKVAERRACDAAFADVCESVIRGVVSNVKTQPGGFVATSGVVLPYYLNLSTNFMSPKVAHSIVTLMTTVIRDMVIPSLHLAPSERIVVVGMESAGGMLVSQLCAFAGASGMLPLDRVDFIYMRKTRKTTGTAQQLEATKEFTSRTPASPRIRAIWVDDCNSTGSSLCEGISTLIEDYNIEVAHALYLVDRSVDRVNLPSARQKLSDIRFVSKLTTISAVFDLSEIDARIPRD